MTYARGQLIPTGSSGTFHCVSRCVRRAFLCGADRYSGQSFEHRRQWVEDRVQELAEIFAVSIWGFGVMSNHLHVVVQTLPEAAARWSADAIAARWIRLFPRRDQYLDKSTGGQKHQKHGTPQNQKFPTSSRGVF